MYVQYIQGLCQPRLGTSDHAAIHVVMLQRLPSDLNGRTLDRRQVQASYIFCVGLLLFRCREHLHFRDFV
jgi:hypothetical protein